MLTRTQLQLLAIMSTFLSLSATPLLAAGNAMGDMPGMDHSNMKMEGEVPAADKPMQEQGMGVMDHGDMQMQGGKAPPDARDPHANSGGYTLGAGPYALPGPRQLRLADEHNFAGVLVDRLERVNLSEGSSAAYDAQAWFGRYYNRLVLKAEGDIANGQLEDASTELLWGHAIATFWDTQVGVRYDSGDGPNRNWLAFGVQGLAPYWFEIDATAYVGENGRTALGFEAEYEVLLTQQLILQPRVETNLYSNSDPARGLGSGLSDLAVGLRLRYEIRREFAPYIGIEWARKFGETEDLAQASGQDTNEVRGVAGVRFWF